MLQVPTVGSKVRVRMSYRQGAVMIPPQPTEHVYEGVVLESHRWLTDREFCLSGDAKWPVRVMNMNGVIDIEMLQGRFKQVDTDTKTFSVQGSKGNKYSVTRTSKGWSCTCTGFQFRKVCKHITELKEKV